MVAYIDGSVLAQLGTPDMRTPISLALAWPGRMTVPAKRLNFAEVGSLTFESPDPERFPALRLARAALRAGGAAPTILNAANEVAVQAFLGRAIGFLDIAEVVEEVLAEHAGAPIGALEDLLALDDLARRSARQRISRTVAR
jgi:1-deoxy-D-xylulose-5-phosphate reductoisomerase